MNAYREIEPLDGMKVQGNDPGRAPEILYLAPTDLVVNEDYQRGISKRGRKLIGDMAAQWDWDSFKPPNVARTADATKYEVIDGQHTAIAALMNGNIPFLPCALGDAATTSDKAKGFIGINRNRISLTKADLYHAEVAAGETAAVVVANVLEATGCKVLKAPPQPKVGYRVGETMAITTLLQLAKTVGEERLTLLVRLLVEAQAAPVSSCLLKAVNSALPPNPPADMVNRVTTILRGQGAGRLEMIAKSRTAAGRRSFDTLSDIISDMAKLGGRRLGVALKSKTESKAAI